MVRQGLLLGVSHEVLRVFENRPRIAQIATKHDRVVHSMRDTAGVTKMLRPFQACLSMSLGADGIAAQIKRQAGFAKGAHLHVMSAINARVGEVRLNIIKLKPLLDLPATCLLVPKHEQCGPLAVMSLQCQSSVANIVRKTKQLVGSAPAGLEIHGNPPRTPSGRKMQRRLW